MFTPKPTDTSELDKAILIALLQLDTVPAYSEEYIQILNQVERLYALKNVNRSPRVSPDTMAVVMGNLLGIVFIVGHERAHVVTSKALSFVMKATR